MSEGEAPRPGQEISDRVHTVIAAAERAADAIRADAEQQARAHIEEASERAAQLTAERLRLIAGLTDELVAQAGTVRHRAEELLAGLDEAIAAVEGQLRSLSASGGAPAEADGPSEAET